MRFRLAGVHLPEWLAMLLLASYATLAVWGALADASVADEHPHILSGLLYWSSGHFSGGVDNPPLGQLWVTSLHWLLRLPYAFADDTYLLVARLPVVLSTLLLGTVLALWARRWLGPWGAAVALGLFVLEPNLLAHGHLATLDAPLAVTWWLALWCFHQWQEGCRLAAVGFVAAVAAAVFTKLSGMLLLPACLAVVLLGTARSRRQGAFLVGLSLVALVLLSFPLYAFEPLRWGLPHHFVQSVAGKLQHRDIGHVAYLLGEQSPRGFLHYYLVVLLVKTPLPLLLFAVLGLVLGRRRLARHELGLLLLPALLALVVFTWMRVHIGVRHVLMVYPALILCATLGVCECWRRGQAVRLVTVLLVGLWATGFARASPRWLSYFNVIAGGGARGDRWLLDSNLDWGQDDRRLAAFLRQAARRGETWQVNPGGEHVQLGRVLVNANTLHNLLRSDATAYGWLRPLQPQAWAGDAWRAYTLDVAAFEQRAASAPDDVEAQTALVEAVYASGDKRRATATLEDASRRLGDVPRLAACGAWMALEEEAPERALAWAERGLRLVPEHAVLGALQQRAALQLELAAAPAARDSARLALQLGLWWAQEHDLQGALPYFQFAARNGAGREAVRAYAIALARTGGLHEAMAALVGPGWAAERQALQRLLEATQQLADEGARVDPDLLYDFAFTAFEEERYEQAAGALVRILRQEPDNAPALVLLCEMQVRTKLRVVNQPLVPRRVLGEDRR